VNHYEKDIVFSGKIFYSIPGSVSTKISDRKTAENSNFKFVSRRLGAICEFRNWLRMEMKKSDHRAEKDGMEVGSPRGKPFVLRVQIQRDLPDPNYK
jgi:hypothetical protein